ncbi:MAG: rRNA maturation RNase YbeY [Alphaproteobacteria bacterium]|nr:rRNA maturation RNase YbeY [Alphaproteobacteria bacterium]
MQIDLTIDENAWRTELPDVEKITEQALEKTRQHPEITEVLNGQAHSEVSITLSDNDFIQNLNKEYRGKNKPTNVLSFPLTDADDPAPGIELVCFGDIILAYETVKQESQDQKKSFRDHYMHLLVHGFLHLLHYDHENEDDAEIMEQLEAEILQKLDIENPYERT